MSMQSNDSMAVQTARHQLAAPRGGSLAARESGAVIGGGFEAALEGAGPDLWRSIGVTVATVVALAVVWFLAREFAVMALHDLWRLSQPAIS